MIDTKKISDAQESGNEIGLTINNAPVSIGFGDKAAIDQANNAIMILTLQNSPSDSQADVICKHGAKSDQITIKAGLSVPQFSIQNFGTNRLAITNVSSGDKTIVKVGLYGHGTATTPLTADGKATIDQYESAGGPTVSNDMLLRLTSKGVSKIFLFSDEDPKVILLNTNPGKDIPEGYIIVPGNQWEIENNWGGNPLFILNASSAPGKIEVKLMNLGE